MDEMEKRQKAFLNLLRDVGGQLGERDVSNIEILNSVTSGESGGNGLKLLDVLRRSGKISSWKTHPLREILRQAERCDLADDKVKAYQMEFEDKGTCIYSIHARKSGWG